MDVIRRPVKEEVFIYQGVEMKLDSNCKVCSILDGTLLYNIHFWRFNLNKTYKEIAQRIHEIDSCLNIDISTLSSHFRNHFPVDKRALLEVAIGGVCQGETEDKLSKYFDQKVKERIRPSTELEELYERVSGWLDRFENNKDRLGLIVKEDLDCFVKLSSELRSILGELNKIRQADAVAKFCVQGFMSRFLEYLLRDLPQELNDLELELEEKVGGNTKEIFVIVDKLKKVWVSRVKDSARQALLETCKEFGLK